MSILSILSLLSVLSFLSILSVLSVLMIMACCYDHVDHVDHIDHKTISYGRKMEINQRTPNSLIAKQSNHQTEYQEVIWPNAHYRVDCSIWQSLVTRSISYPCRCWATRAAKNWKVRKGPNFGAPPQMDPRSLNWAHILPNSHGPAKIWIPSLGMINMLVPNAPKVILWHLCPTGRSKKIL